MAKSSSVDTLKCTKVILVKITFRTVTYINLEEYLPHRWKNWFLTEISCTPAPKIFVKTKKLSCDKYSIEKNR